MRRRHHALLLCLSLAAGAAGCSDNGTEPKRTEPGAAALRVTPQAPSLRLGESTTLDVEFVDASGRPVAASGTVSWSSSANDVASVDGAGIVTAHAVGSATVEARSGSLTGSTDVTVRPPAPVTGANVPVSATIDTAGGTIMAVAADGTRYTLRVPRLALREATQITLTPIASIEDFPAAAGASAAVLLEPDGLRFTAPAELTIVAPAPFAATSVAFSQSSDAFLLEPAQVVGDTARLLIGHFSSAGTTVPTAEEVAALMPGSGDTESTARHGVTEELNRAAEAGAQPDQSVIAQHLKDWFDDGVMPGLEAAAAGTRNAEDAIGEWIRWLTNVQTWADGHLEGEISSGHDAAAVALRAGIDRLNQQCRDQNDASLVADILHLAALAALLGADEIDPSLGLDRIFADLCVRIAIEATLPEPFAQGSTLTVRAGLAIGEHPASYDTPLDITLSSASADLSRASGVTNASGELTTDVDLRDGHAEVVIDIEAVHPTTAQMRARYRVTSRARYELELNVDGGAHTTLEPGDVAWLDVTLRKAEAPLSGAAVSLSVLGGGSIEPASTFTDERGLGASVYTAPEEGDTVQVVATFAEGDELLSDTVTIEVIETPTGSIRIEDIYQAYGVGAMARQVQLPTMNDGLDDWTFSTGELSGGYSASASTGSAVAAGSVTHRSNIVHRDADTLLVVESRGDVDGSVAADPGVQAGATLTSGSDAHIVFEVLDEPVYYQIVASGVRSAGGGSAVDLWAVNSNATIVSKTWHAVSDSLVTSGWLGPGLYSFDAAASVGIGAGSNNPDGESSANGSASYDVVFRILEEEPEEPEASP